MVLHLDFTGGASLSLEGALKHDGVAKKEVELGQLCQTLNGSALASFGKGVEEHGKTRGVQLGGLIEVGNGLDEVHYPSSQGRSRLHCTLHSEVKEYANPSKCSSLQSCS
jgi:hypothetical protein